MDAWRRGSAVIGAITLVSVGGVIATAGGLLVTADGLMRPVLACNEVSGGGI